MKSLREIFQRNSDNSEKKELNYVSPFSDALNFGQYIANATSMSVSAVSRAVNIISDSIAMLPIQVVNFNEDHIQVDPNHPLNTIFNSAHINSYNLKACLIRDVLLYGNGYAYIFRDGISGMPESLLYLPATTVTCDYNEVAGTVTYSCTKLKNLKKLLPQNIIHLKKYTTDGVNGISVLKYASRSIGIANATEDQCKDFFESGCNLSGVLTVEGQLSDRQKNDIRTSWQLAYGGGAHGLAILQGNMKYQPVQLNATDSQLLDSRRYNIEDIARFFGIPAIMLTGAESSNLESAQHQFLLHCLQPYIVMLEEEFTRKLNVPNYGIKLDISAILRTDKAAMASYYQTMLASGILCINEVRADMGLAPIEGGDKHIIPYTNLNQNTVNQQENGQGTEEQSDIQ